MQVESTGQMSVARRTESTFHPLLLLVREAGRFLSFRGESPIVHGHNVLSTRDSVEMIFNSPMSKWSRH